MLLRRYLDYCVIFPGQATNAELGTTNSVVSDMAGNIYIADSDNNRIRKVNTLGIISTVAGNGTSGFSGDGGQAVLASLNFPDGIALDVFDKGSLQLDFISTE